MGEVFLATQTGLGAFAKPLVLKLLLPHLTQSLRAVEMFLDEARLASRMNHPNVVSIFDVGMIEGRYFIAMELVRGVSLARLVSSLRDRGEAVPPELWIYIARSLCDGLQHAHDQRGPDGRPLDLIHRDVTLENVLVSVDGQVKLTDFGIARAQNGLAAPSVAGKRGYVAPEVLALAPYDKRVDIFGAAVTLWSLAVLERPHERDGELSSDFRTPLPPEALAAVKRGAASDANQRFQTARALRDALPPLTTFDAAERLGALVQRVCAHQVRALDGDVQRTGMSSAPATQSVSLLATTKNLRQQQATPTPPPRRRSLLMWAAPAVLLFAGAGAWIALRQPTEAPPQPAQVPTSPIAAPPRGAQEPLDGPSTAPAGTLVAAVPIEALPTPTATTRPTTTPSPAIAATAAVKPQGAKKGKRPTPKLAATPPPLGPAEAGVGVLKIDAQPWALVTLNGKPVGETPISRLPVPAGAVELELTNPETKRSVRKRLSLVAGQTVTISEDLR
jgi:serine/threonine-protein kinase